MAWRLLFLIFLTTPALAFNNGRYPTDTAISHWYADQHDANGNYCCNKADGHDFYGDYRFNADGSVEFDDGGVHYHLPAAMVLLGPNPTGNAVWWHSDGRPVVSYCFAPGPMQ